AFLHHSVGLGVSPPLTIFFLSIHGAGSRYPQYLPSFCPAGYLLLSLTQLQRKEILCDKLPLPVSCFPQRINTKKKSQTFWVWDFYI
ncbi:hypothetical protein, partial [Flavobacterium sp.]|uniref:hypothetical protein n=1 Tax=Flavobacterium sp. TaxID=239 RepID=UPI003342B7A0